MKKFILPLILTLVLPLTGRAQTETGEREFPRLEGPATATLAGVAQIEVPAGYIYIDGRTMRRLLEAVGQPVSDGLVGSLSPTNADWSVMFYYDPIGYVKDDDKDKLNADKLLEDYRTGTEQANKYRAKYGAAPIHVVGWELPPRYNEETHNLEWALRGASEGEEILNYDTRLLGRKGVMSVKLIVSPREYAATFPVFTNLIAGYKFNSGESYAEYRPGDKIAKYGLGALVLGGATVGAAKLGLLAWLGVFLKKFWKFVVVLVVAVAAVFKKAINRIVNGGRGQD
jgi:uncharacterized membrane-anchored protein